MNNNNNNNSNGISNVDQAILNNAAIVGNIIKNYIKNTIVENGNNINWTVLIILFIFIIFL